MVEVIVTPLRARMDLLAAVEAYGKQPCAATWRVVVDKVLQLEKANRQT